MVFSFRFIIILAFLITAGCSTYKAKYRIRLLSTPCIKPFYKYEYKTCSTLKVEVNEDTFEVPANFKTDLASIPRIIWPIVSPSYSALIHPSIIHDYLYHNDCLYSRKDADLIFYESLRQNHIPFLTANIMYYTLRLAGWSAYSKEQC